MPLRQLPMIRSVAGLTAAFLILAGCGEREPATSEPSRNRAAAIGPAAAERPEQAIERLEREWAAAHLRKDFGWYDRHVAPNYRTVLVDGVIASRADVIKHLQSSPPGQQLQVDAVEVRPHGDAAVATVTQSFRTASGKAGKLRVTDVWVKSDAGRWMVVHSHETPLRGEAG